jgi:ABC-type lipoprotein export system ATPase subunit
MSDPLVTFRGVTRRFEGGRIVALDHVDLEIGRGTFVAVTGPSGSGKTTLLNVMGAMDLPDEGEVVLDGERIDSPAAMERVRARKIGFVFQMHNLIPVLDAAENVAIPLVPDRLPRGARRARALELLEAVGLRDRADTNVRVLSGGERQRIAIARAMVKEPPLILADEPTGNLDTKTSDEIMTLLVDLNRSRGITVLMVTHELEMARYASRVVEFLDGRIASDSAIRKAA